MATESVHSDLILRVALPGEKIDGYTVTQSDIVGLDTALKITHNLGVIVSQADIVGGTENAIDCDDSTDVSISGTFGSDIPLGPNAQVLTIKGGCVDIHAGGIIRGKPGRQNSHIQVGQWMDQSYAMTKHVTLDFKHASGANVNVVTGWVMPFTVALKGDCRWLFVESMKLKAYIIAKFIVRFVMRIPKGIKGPSWL